MGLAVIVRYTSWTFLACKQGLGRKVLVEPWFSENERRTEIPEAWMIEKSAMMLAGLHKLALHHIVMITVE